MVKITLAMIVKNEELFLPACLESVKNVVSEMIIIDTGSIDNTKEIAKKFGAKVIDHAWNGDFSEARNIALENSSGDWILHLDADEILATNQPSDLAFLQSSRCDAYLIAIKDSATNEDRALVRLFRNDPDIRYKGKIHEEIVFGGLATNETSAAGHTTGMSSLIIKHFGYDPSIIEMKAKADRNLEILINAYKNDPDDIKTIYHLGQTYGALNNLKEAEKYFKFAFEHPKANELPVIFRDLIVCLGFQSKFAEAVLYAERAEKIIPEYTEITFQKAVFLYISGRFEEALITFDDCIKKGPSPIALPSTPSGTTTLSYLFKSLCLMRAGRELEADSLMKFYWTEISRDPNAVLYLGRLYLHLYPPEKARNELLKIADVSQDLIASLVKDMFNSFAL